jgi:uncharacterized protein YbjT (DUF2867 family)
MFVVLGASGHTGAVVAKNLIAGGQKVRVVRRSAEHTIAGPARSGSVHGRRGRPCDSHERVQGR